MAKKKHNSVIPKYSDFYIPLVKSLVLLGGSGSIVEINEKIYQICGFSDELLNIPHDDKGYFTEIDYRIAWARTYLKKYGLLDNSSRGIWALNNLKIDPDSLDPELISKTVKNKNAQKDENQIIEVNDEVSTDIDESENWKKRLLNILYEITPGAFERLSQRFLRETGFTQVEVMGKSGDGGIDGKGIVTINGVLSFHMIFQCKRYKGSVTPSQVRDFRGAMQGRADKGIFITTGTFTREAIKEATRDGAPPIDLVDGELLCERLKALKIGIEIELIEKIEINETWFLSL